MNLNKYIYIYIYLHTLYVNAMDMSHNDHDHCKIHQTPFSPVATPVDWATLAARAELVRPYLVPVMFPELSEKRLATSVLSSVTLKPFSGYFEQKMIFFQGVFEKNLGTQEHFFVQMDLQYCHSDSPCQTRDTMGESKIHGKYIARFAWGKSKCGTTI